MDTPTARACRRGYHQRPSQALSRPPETRQFRPTRPLRSLSPVAGLRPWRSTPDHDLSRAKQSPPVEPCQRGMRCVTLETLRFKHILLRPHSYRSSFQPTIIHVQTRQPILVLYSTSAIYSAKDYSLVQVRAGPRDIPP
jgi:hypothetical protein